MSKQVAMAQLEVLFLGTGRAGGGPPPHFALHVVATSLQTRSSQGAFIQVVCDTTKKRERLAERGVTDSNWLYVA